MLFDTHAHLDDEAYDVDRREVLTQIRNSDVKKIVNAASSLKSAHAAVRLAEENDFIYAAVGIHPHDVSQMEDKDLLEIKKLASHKKVVAIGEIGLDYYYDFSPKEVQKFWFAEQIKLAEELHLPYIVHSRDATKDTFDIIQENTKKSNFVMHCYSQSKEMVKRYTDLGGYISFAGTLTFKNAHNLKDALTAVPLDRLLIETDSPYLSPVPMRGKRNSPLYVKHVAEEISRLLNVSYEDVCNLTYKNALRFFNLDTENSVLL